MSKLQEVIIATAAVKDDLDIIETQKIVRLFFSTVIEQTDGDLLKAAEICNQGIREANESIHGRNGRRGH